MLAGILFLLTGCNPAGGELQDDSIDADLRAEIAALNKQVISGLANNQPEKVLALCSDDLRKSPEHRKAMKQLATDAHAVIHPESFAVRKQFYERRRAKNSSITVSTGTTNEHDYSIIYQAQTRKSYLTVGYIEDSIRTYAVLTVYGNYNGAWKLNILRVGAVKIFGKDAVDWYYKARQQYGDNAIADAFNSETMCKSLLQPCGEGWHYRNEEDMASLSEQIKNTAERHFSFPIMVEEVATKPRIFNVSSLLFNEGYFPGVHYATKLPLSDTAALAKECDSLNAHIGSIFQGLDNYNKTIVYHAYPQVPNGDEDTAVPYYAMIKKSAASWFY